MKQYEGVIVVGRYIASHALAVAAAPDILDIGNSSSSASASMQPHALRHTGVGWLLGCEGMKMTRG